MNGVLGEAKSDDGASTGEKRDGWRLFKYKKRPPISRRSFLIRVRYRLSNSVF